MRILTFHIAVLYVTFISVARSEGLEDDSLLVETSSGVVQGGIGKPTVGKNRPVYWFRSIPYAEPPVDDLRFEPPVPKRKWTGTLDVSEDSVQCIHGSNETKGSEDCLNLKIYTTTLPEEQKKLPVFVFIHGGAFIFGSPNFTAYKPDLLLDEDVVVVAPQYRLGIFGFLSTGDMVAPGNNGIKDLVLALTWVKENIEAFGGDPDNITIAGQSAGSALVSYLLQTNHTKGLFNRAIMHSGTSLCLWAYFRKSVEFAAGVAEYLKLDVNGTQGLFDQLKLMDATELLKAQGEVLLEFLKDSNPRNGVILGPVVEPEHEGAVFSGRSYQELLKGNFHRVPLIVGHTSLEAYLNDIPGILRFYLGQFDIFVSKLVPIDMYIEDLIQSHMVGSTIKKEYFGNDMIALSDFKLMKYISDDQFERPVQQSIKLYSDKTPVYYYKFSHEGALHGVVNRTWPGVGHTEDLGYIFVEEYEGSETDYLVRKRMVKLWTNFIKTGNPTPEADPLLDNVIWPPNVGSVDLKCLNITEKLDVLEQVDSGRMRFWGGLYEKVDTSKLDTY